MKDIEQKQFSTNADDFDLIQSHQIIHVDNNKNETSMLGFQESGPLEKEQIYYDFQDGQFIYWKQDSPEFEQPEERLITPTQNYQDQSQSEQLGEEAQSDIKSKKTLKKQKKKIDKNSLNSFERQSGLSAQLKKSVNVPKTVGRILMDRFREYQSDFKDHPQFFKQLRQELTFLSKWVKQSKKNSFKLVNLTQLFNNPEKLPQQCFLTRLIMQKILSKSLRKEIIPNNQVKTKLEYLIASKVYSLRCRNAKLATRMQMR